METVKNLETICGSALYTNEADQEAKPIKALAANYQYCRDYYFVTEIDGKRYAATNLYFEGEDDTEDNYSDVRKNFDGKKIVYFDFREIEDGKTIDDYTSN